MKKFFFIVLTTMLTLSACKEQGEHFNIDGHITSADSKTLYFEAVTLDGIQALDSVKLDDEGDFEFSSARPTNPEFFRLRIDGQIINIAIDSTETIKIEADFPTMSTDYKIEGSKECLVIREISRKQIAVQNKINNIAQNKQLTTGTQNRLINEAIEEYKNDLKNNYIIQEPWSAHAYFAIFQAIGHMLVFDPVNNAEDVRFLGAVATGWNEHYSGTVRAKNLENITLRGMQNTKRPKRQEINLSDLPNVEVSETGLIDIALPNINGKIKTLSGLKGKVVMLDFTAYSIPKSQERILELRTLYNDYASKGFEIYQVSLDPEEHYWKTVSENLPWICVFEKDGTASSYINLYQVKTLPTYFLIDRDGNVIARSENIPDTRKAIDNLL